ncbi:GNAT family N-acetyltransferase [Mucilaginibacter sp. L3T2-6]|uniref:GNAT family N-acetyltransferase n=1 Tax=Mucilaginibacter sp. L3T2-6 TaxID=3062491 RepID=UPI0026745348|nr:GNAT family N-acetyltransferase [Mucilaginibacter sp. L3T2-6]MDO3642038.1 GNAT family N-acetyltransferase [Mucilaginibacter sp. L3T2-6]MDV6214284.1 GNAT family N-acetyltransferase [Mucilaginibacter sp. L3T2-6]
MLKTFDELTVYQLYQILKLRSAIFVLEQQCLYQDMDDKDQQCYHLMIFEDNQLAAYTRLLPAGLSFKEVSIGRVITNQAFRGRGLARKIMQQSIEACYELFGKQPIRIGAQLYLKDFYGSLGFIQQGEMYLEDDIPHIEMLLAV